MDKRLLPLALAAFVALPAFATVDTPLADEPKRVRLTPDMSPDEIRKVLREGGVPDEQIEKTIGRIAAMKAARSKSGAGPAASAASTPAAPTAAGTTAPGGKTAPAKTPAAPAALDTAELESKALESKDPALETDRKAVEVLKREKSLLEARIALAETKRRKELFPLAEERGRLDAERAMFAVRKSARDADADTAKTALERELALAAGDDAARLADKSAKLKALETEARVFKAKTEADQAAVAARLAVIRATADARLATWAPKEYPADPVKNGVLTISDRRIPFNGVVSEPLADFVTERLAFYNNADPEKPIFIVIDSSPGGSVMAGYRILNAMQSSRAPVYVVVKQFAASMAAITTTSAVRSFCYPGTIILHHQMSTGFQGNMRTLAENMTFANDLFERIFRPIYTKIGYKDSQTFVADMYKHFNSGDWLAFGDEAVKMKWATDLVTEIRETAVRENSADDTVGKTGGNYFAEGCELRRDENGKVYYLLPPLLSPGDAWDIHDPQRLFHSR